MYNSTSFEQHLCFCASSQHSYEGFHHCPALLWSPGQYSEGACAVHLCYSHCSLGFSHPIATLTKDTSLDMWVGAPWVSPSLSYIFKLIHSYSFFQHLIVFNSLTVGKISLLTSPDAAFPDAANSLKELLFGGTIVKFPLLALKFPWYSPYRLTLFVFLCLRNTKTKNDEKAS